MKFTCNKQLLLKATSALSKVTPPKAVNPVFENIKMTAHDGSVLLMATDGDVTLVCNIPTDGEQEEGSAATPMRVFLPMASALPGESITVQSDKDQVILSWDTGNAILPNMNPNDFPEIPSSEGLDMRMVAGEEFSKALRKTVFAMGEDPLRQVLNNINISVHGNAVSVAASDSHIIAVVRTLVNAASKDFSLNIPSRVVGVLKNIATAEDELQMVFSEIGSRAIFKSGDGVTLYCSLDRKKYPDYEQVIGVTGKRLAMNRDAALSAVKTVGIFSGTNNRITFHLNDNVSVNADDVNFAVSARCDIPGATWDGPDMDIAFNGGSFRELLESLAPADDIVLEISAPNRCVLATSVEDVQKSYRVGLMPILTQKKNTNKQ